MEYCLQKKNKKEINCNRIIVWTIRKPVKNEEGYKTCSEIQGVTFLGTKDSLSDLNFQKIKKK